MRTLSLVLVVALMTACGATPPPFKPIADTKLLMQATVDPAADHVWDAAGTIITAAGEEELGPKNEEEWVAVRNSAVTLAESANLLMMVPRAKDGDEWMRLCQALAETAATAIRAAEARNKDQIFDAGAEIYGVCTNCHSKYALDLGRFTQ
jgi:hypothetical protein